MSESVLERPRLTDPDAEREESWLELFYDLVYVAMIIQLGNVLSDEVSVAGAVVFVGLFVPIWWTWTVYTFFMNRFVVDDVTQRVLTFVQVFAIVGVGISVGGASGALASQFASAYAAVRLVQVAQYVRTGRHVPEANALIRRYTVGFSVVGVCWLLSVFVPPPAKYGLWILGMGVDFYVGLSAGSRRLQRRIPPDPEHLSGRYGAFTIIVLGEGFIKVIDESAGEVLLVTTLVYGAIGLVIVASVWWLYFDDVAGSLVRDLSFGSYVWVYAHLPLTAAVVAFGVGIQKVVVLAPGEALDPQYRWLLCVAVGTYLVSIAAIDYVTETDVPLDDRRRAYVRFAGAGVALTLAVVGGVLGIGPLLALLAAAVGVPVVLDVYARHAARPPASASG